jgi:hypothetical protein
MGIALVILTIASTSSVATYNGLIRVAPAVGGRSCDATPPGNSQCSKGGPFRVPEVKTLRVVVAVLQTLAAYMCYDKFSDRPSGYFIFTCSPLRSISIFFFSVTLRFVIIISATLTTFLTISNCSSYKVIIFSISL